MGRLMVGSCILLLLAGTLFTGFAASPVIGIATATGSFLMDNAPVQGNATVFNGAVVETSAAPSTLRLQGGPRMELGSTSRGRVYNDRLILEKGNGRMEGAQSYWIEARTLHIVPASAASSAQVAIREAGQVTVAALTGDVRVTTSAGTLLAMMPRGTALEFEPPPQTAGASAPISVSGCLANVGGHFLLTDDTAKVTFEVRGQDLAQYAGQHISVTATVLKDVHAGEGASEVVQATQVKKLGGGCPASAGAGRKAAGAGAAGAAKVAGMSVGTKAVIAGVVIAAAAGGTAMGLTGRESSSSTISR